MIGAMTLTSWASAADLTRSGMFQQRDQQAPDDDRVQHGVAVLEQPGCHWPAVPVGDLLDRSVSA